MRWFLVALLVAVPAGLARRPDPPPAKGCGLTVVTERARVCLFPERDG